jgi:cell shape-determining protein MreC
MRKNWIFYFLIFLIVVLIFLSPKQVFEIKKKLIGLNQNNEDKLLELKKENLILKAELAKLSNLNNFLAQTSKRKIKPAFVYSYYPFNLKNEILINLGEKDELTLEEAVVLPPQTQDQTQDLNFVLLGKIKKIYKNFSLVQTIFDPDFKLAVKIGQSQSDALLVGGPKPKLNLISKDAGINIGDIIYSAQSNLPYGLVVGEIKEINALPIICLKKHQFFCHMI